MRSAPNNYENTLLKIQSEINEVTRRENELRELHKQNSLNGDSTTLPTKSDTKVLQRAVSTSNLTNVNGNNVQRRFIPNSKGVMQKFFKLRGKVSAVSAISANPNANLNPVQKITAWNTDITIQPPVKALIPTDKPLRKGYVPVEARILSELREMENREHELKIERRRSQTNLTEPNLFSEDNSNSNSISDYESSRTPSPATFNKLKPARSLSQLLDEDYSEQSNSLKPARSLAQLCDVSDEEIVSSKSLIKQWENRIKEQKKDT